MFKCQITRKHSDGAYDIHFEADDTTLTVRPRFFSSCLVPDDEQEDREEIDEEMLNNARPKDGEEEDSNNDDEQESEEEKSERNIPQPRGRPRRNRQSVVDNDSSDVEEEAEDPEEIARAVEDENREDEDDADDDNDVTFGEIDEVVEREAYAFDPSPNGTPRTLAFYKDWSPYRIFVHLFIKIIDYTVQCTNRQIPENISPISTSEIMVFIAVYLFMGIVHLPSVKYYWYPEELSEWIVIPNFRDKMTYSRFKEIKQILRFEQYDLIDEEVKDNDKAWKIRKVFTYLQKAFQGIMSVAGEFLSVDEAMVRCCGRFVLRRLCPKKPIKVGAKFYALVDHRTKICMNISLCDGIITSENSQGYAWGAAGRRVIDLLQFVTTRWHRVYTDNYYTSIALANELLRMGIYLVGTIRANMIPSKALKQEFGTAKHPKPSRHNPKGKWRSVSTSTLTIHALMDSSVVYVLDTTSSSDSSAEIERREGANEINFDGPSAINDYNAHMGGVDQWDQMRTSRAFSVEQVGKSTKWTITLFLSFISMAASNAFCIYRFNNPPGSDKHLDHTQFQVQLMKGLYNNTYEARDSRSTPGSTNETAPVTNLHKLMQCPKGSHPTEPNRRLRGRCRAKGCLKTTTFGCKKCCIAVCATPCFEKFHASNRVGYVKKESRWAEVLEDIP